MMDQFINGEHAETIKLLIKNKRWLESFYKKQYVTILQKFYLEIVLKWVHQEVLEVFLPEENQPRMEKMKKAFLS